MSNDNALFTKPEVTHTEDEDSPAGLIFLGLFFFGLAVAMNVFWDTVTDENGSRRYRGVARILDRIGTIPVTAVLVLIAVLLVVSGTRALMKERRRSEFIKADRGA